MCIRDRQNTEYYYFTNQPDGFVLFKADGDQDRPNLPLNAYSRGMGAMGLPGDLSSQSRFVRAAFVRANSRRCV